MKIDLLKLTRYFSEQGPVLLLDSQSRTHPWSRKSYLAALPELELSASRDHISITTKNKHVQRKLNPWKALQDCYHKYDDWLFGYLGYDLKNYAENLYSGNDDPVQAPDSYFMIPQFLLEVNHQTEECRCIKGELPELSAIKGGSTKNDKVRLTDLVFQTSKKNYLKKIAQVQHYIREGDCYEVNLSHQLKAKMEGSALGLYQRMRKAGPVPFGAYLKKENFAVCCQSPERFLRKEGPYVLSQPIKGTAKRSNNIERDEYLKKRLCSSPKERAENLMIVDLVRNDLSRIAQPDSVNVSELFGIQSFETVHQMVSTVEARTTESPISVLKACFPMGSMTGAPKIRAMEIIEELEDYKRGIYSGAIGYISPAGNFDFNVVIRSAIKKGREVYYATGGAITADSNPAAEWQETCLKAQAFTYPMSRKINRAP